MNIFNTVQDVIANFSIVTAYLFLVNQFVFRKRALGPPTSFANQLLIGFIAGLLGILLMVFTVQTDGSFIDFRQIALVIAALHGGVAASAITGLIVFLMRMFAFGAISTATVVASANTLLIAVVVGLLFKSKLSYWKKWTYALLVCNVLTSIVFYVNLREKSLLPIFIYIIMMSLGGWFTAYLSQFLAKAKAYFDKVEREATVDFLTGLHNHRTFDQKFNTSLQAAEEKQDCLSIALVDIDYFKKVNDRYGHSNGDAVLKQLGDLLMQTARTFDIVSRNGGEEFSVLMYDTPHEHALSIAEKFRIAVEQHHFRLNDGQSIRLTVSIGVATYPDTNRDDLIDQADGALYQAKTDGRNAVRSSRAIKKQI
ncbi:GGDEF domain-containing protein [Paenibacillus nanensis]|uniref:GGDEF domain-containing protein n=1 Tax=Paenibacillus nanensis TaxID=393251 RepID=A0A3A1UY07_9BACL|nr:diguanylate cyclase [Paenibacillus nanensis]RIX53408.1 GGDEF domain-containing protein [Paenibacillus nanensis]